MTFLPNWQKWSCSLSMIVSFSNTSKPDVAEGLPRLSHQPPPRLPFIWLHSGQEDQILCKIQRKKLISTQGGGSRVFSNISQANYSKTELFALAAAWRVAAPTPQFRNNTEDQEVLTDRISNRGGVMNPRPSWEIPGLPNRQSGQE